MHPWRRSQMRSDTRCVVRAVLKLKKKRALSDRVEGLRNSENGTSAFCNKYLYDIRIG
jgi:hypothetical protein